MSEYPFVTRLVIRGLHYYKDFDITFDSSIKILVGENGAGKTSILTILFAILKKNWLLLAPIGFDSVYLQFKNNQTIKFLKSDLDGYLLFRYQGLKTLNYLNDKFAHFSAIIDNTVDKEVIYIPAFRNLKYDLDKLGGVLKLVQQDLQVNNNARNDSIKIEEDLLIPISFDEIFNNLNKAVSFSAINLFVRLCNSYLVNTFLVFNEKNKSISIVNKEDQNEVSTNQLSSGEKQIVYVFCKIFLQNSNGFYLLFDEPELHLSLTWQRMFLVDIINSQKCFFLFCATQSPFVFDNSLDRYAADMQKNIKM